MDRVLVTEPGHGNGRCCHQREGDLTVAHMHLDPALLLPGRAWCIVAAWPELVLQDAVDDTGPVEPGRDGEPPGHRGGLEPADLLHPPDVQLQVRSLRG